jgi:hypothetical protein
MTQAKAKPSAGPHAPRGAAFPESPATPGDPAVPRHWARLVELAALALCLIYALWFWVRLPGELPSAQNYVDLQAALQAEAQPGDGVAVLPFWAERAKVYIHGTPVLALPQLDREPDAERYARLWVIAQPDLPHSDAVESLEALGHRLNLVRGPRRFGPLELWLFAPKEGRAATENLVAHAGEAQVQSAAPLQVEWHEFDFLPRRCLVSRGGQAVLHFSQVPVHHGVRVGLGTLVSGQSAGAQVSIDGHPLQPFQLVEGGAGFQTAELSADGLSAGLHDLDLGLFGRAACADAVVF